MNGLQTMERQRVVPVIRTSDANHAMRLTELLLEEGITAVEITTTIPDSFSVVEQIRRAFPTALVAVGTIRDASMARTAIDSGAQVLVTYKVSSEIAQVGRGAGIPCILGGATPSEVDRCVELGCPIVKVFPASVVGMAFIREMKGPMPAVKYFPTGGIGLQDVKTWLDAGAAVVGLGRALWHTDPGQDDRIIRERIRAVKKEIGVS